MTTVLVKLNNPWWGFAMNGLDIVFVLAKAHLIQNLISYRIRFLAKRQIHIVHYCFYFYFCNSHHGLLHNWCWIFYFIGNLKHKLARLFFLYIIISFLSFVSVLQEGGKVFCWGWNKYGQVLISHYPYTNTFLFHVLNYEHYWNFLSDHIYFKWGLVLGITISNIVVESYSSKLCFLGVAAGPWGRDWP